MEAFTPQGLYLTCRQLADINTNKETAQINKKCSKFPEEEKQYFWNTGSIGPAEFLATSLPKANFWRNSDFGPKMKPNFRSISMWLNSRDLLRMLFVE